jgi:hypothetical protein
VSTADLLIGVNSLNGDAPASGYVTRRSVPVASHAPAALPSAWAFRIVRDH